MKAAVLYGNDDLRYDDYEKPVIKSKHVMVQVKSTGICGSDVPRVFYNKAHSYPIVLGHEFSGVIAEIGEGVSGFELGCYVSGVPLVPCMSCRDCQGGNYSLCKQYTFIGSRIQGSFADYVMIPASNAVRFDDSISFDQGAFFEPSTVALHGIRCNDYKGGGRVAILGGGTIGLFTMQWAKIFGAKSVTVFDISQARLDIAKEFDADFTINSKDENFEENCYDYVFETAGITDTMKLAFLLAANKAKICFIGTPTKELCFTPAIFENMNRKEFRLTGSWMSYSAPFPGEEWELTAHAFKTGQLKFSEKLIFKRFPMSQAAEAFSLFKTPGAVSGKIILYNE